MKGRIRRFLGGLIEVACLVIFFYGLFLIPLLF
jgi:hypothetical protein